MNFMIHFEVVIITELQGFITSKLIRLDNKTVFDGFDCPRQETFGKGIGNNPYYYKQNNENFLLDLFPCFFDWVKFLDGFSRGTNNNAVI